MTPDIDPVEATMAVIGLRTIISKEVERITKGTLTQVANLGKKVAQQSRALVNDELEETFYSDLNYRAMLHDLAEGVDLGQVQEMAERFPPEFQDLGMALATQAAQIVQALEGMVPKSLYQTATGLQNLAPPDVEVWKFVSILEVLDDPLLVFPLMSTGALLRSQAQAVRTLYPILCSAIDAALFDAALKAKQKRKSFELSPRAEHGVRVWAMSRPPESPEEAQRQQEIKDQHSKRIQASQAVAQKAKDDQAQRKAASQAGKMATQDMTQTQRDPARPG